MFEDIDGFDWDSGNWPKCGKHGVSQEEVEILFASSPSLFEDPFPEEKRTRAIGAIYGGRYLYAVFVIRIVDGERLIRPVSARYMHQREVERYEKYKAQKNAASAD